MSENAIVMKPTEEEAEFCEKIIFELFEEFDVRIEERHRASWRPDDPHLSVDSSDGPGADPEEDSLTDIWPATKQKLRGLIPLVFNFLRNLDCKDLVNAANILRASNGTKRDILIAILEFIADKMGRTAVGGKPEVFTVEPRRETKNE